ncbi:hypothetical protein [Brevundimonas sp. FT23028]|uniref:hypothetical protein n=1 Tax=Brevundimonas sp. FT23028 TaxID=3393748 RepID=UPI003B5884E2
MSVRFLLSSAAAAALLSPAGVAAAQTAPQPGQAIPTVVVDDRTAPPPAAPAYGSGGDSGTTTLNLEAIEARAPGSGDANGILRILPTAQFSTSAGNATRDDLQDLRPETVSISGGSINDNLFILDGVGVNNYGYDEDANPGDFTGAGVASASAQTHWVDTSLLGEVTVRDSNIPARYGDFQGGVVELTTRAPGPVFGVQGYYGLTSDGMAQYRMSDLARDSFAGAAPDAPEFEKERFGFNVDLPVSARFRLLAGYNQTTATVTNFPGANYVAWGAWGQRSRSENYLLKGEYDLADSLRMTAQVSYSPYESEARQTNTAYDNRIVSRGGGLTTRLGLEGTRGEAAWSLDLSHADTDNDRDAPWGTFNISSAAPGLSGCSLSSSCTIGSAGDFYQDQQLTTLKGDWEQPLGFGVLSAGFELSHVEAHRERPQELVSHLTTDISANTVCTTGESLACRNGAYALTTQLRYAAFSADAEIDSYAVWGEYQFDLAGFDVRAGLRYDHETFLDNHNIAPRLSVSRDLPWAGVNVTAGVNRYYNRSFVGYTLREGAGVIRQYRRTPTTVGAERRWDDTWVLTSHTDSNRYSGLGLDTPYSDEATLALTGPFAWIGGQYRIKGILREGRDQISRSARFTEIYDRETGSTATRSVYYATNDGERSYRGLSLEYTRPVGEDHTLTFSTNFSHTDATNLSLFDMADESELSGVMVYYDGEVVDVLQALSDNQVEDYASPFIVNADWSARWLDGRVRTNLNARYRQGIEVVADTGANISVGGATYDVYDKVEYSDSVDVNLGVEAEIVRTAYGVVSVDARINNLFNTVLNPDYQSATQPYQLGRNAWISIKFRY